MLVSHTFSNNTFKVLKTVTNLMLHFLLFWVQTLKHDYVRSHMVVL